MKTLRTTTVNITGKTIGEMWLNLIKEILDYNEESFDEGRRRIALQCVNVVALTQNPSDELMDKYGNKQFIKEILNLTFEKEKMYDFDVVPSFNPGAKSYYKRLNEGKLVEFVIKRLTHFPESKKAVIVFPNNEDYETVLANPNNDYLPCIISIQFRLLPNYYSTMNTIFYARSIDAYQKSLGNFVAIATLSHKIAKELSKNLNRNIKVGKLVGLIADAHIYNECLEDARNMMKEYNGKSN